ncbi:MAG TPA: hypothetical protein PKD91_04040 [Bacteroidia bacterium]|nr:hypothetical protein [Bacteroidia bacterium]
MITINELHLRIPGISESEGESLGSEISEKIAAGLPVNYSGQHIPELTIKIENIIHGERSQMADRISEQVLNQINLRLLK